MAVLFERGHRLQEARAAVDKCLVIDRNDEQARYFSAFLDRREGKLEEAERGLRGLIASGPRHSYVRYSVHYELAQVLDKTGRPEEAMAELAKAKAMVRELADIEEIKEVYDSTIALSRMSGPLQSDTVREWARSFPECDRAPVGRVAFLGGHPRSGTTLMEQILGAHPQIAALDEPHLFPKVFLPEMRKPPPLSATRLNAIRRLYTEELAREFGPGAAGRLLLEKNPSLTAALPMLLRAFPDLRVIIALRDPRDVVLSCYFQNIPLNVANSNFLTLERTARHYANLMDVWLAVRKCEGFAWIETRYEDTVAAPEGEGRRITEFLGLEWDPSQARCHEDRRRVFSPSYHDVTLPVHRRSVARWRAYEKHLAHVLPILEPYCRAFGYET
jgi:hypothetical protein